MKISTRLIFCLLVAIVPISMSAQYAITAVYPASLQQGYQGMLTVSTTFEQPFENLTPPYTIRITGPDGTIFEKTNWAHPSSSTEIIGEISILTNSPAGTYSIQVTNQGQFNTLSWSSGPLLEITPLNSRDLGNELAISVGPNPLKDHLTLDFPIDHAAQYDASLYSIEGKILRSWSFEIGAEHQQQLDIENLANGPYFLRIENEVIRRSFRIIVQN